MERKCRGCLFWVARWNFNFQRAMQFWKQLQECTTLVFKFEQYKTCAIVHNWFSLIILILMIFAWRCRNSTKQFQLQFFRFNPEKGWPAPFRVNCKSYFGSAFPSVVWETFQTLFFGLYFATFFIRRYMHLRMRQVKWIVVIHIPGINLRSWTVLHWFKQNRNRTLEMFKMPMDFVTKCQCARMWQQNSN